MVSIAVEFAPAGGTTWTALTCEVYGVGWARGATEDRGALAVPEAGQCVAYLVDPNRDLDPENAAGAYAGAIDVGAQLRVKLAGAPAFTGIVDSIAHELDPGRAPYPLARISVIDAVSKAAGVKTAGGTFPQETSSARITRLLDAAQVATGSGQRDIQAGGVTIAAAPGIDQDAWSDLLEVVGTELGTIDIRPDGKVVTRTRTTAWTPTAPVLQLGCQPGAIPLDQLRLASQRSTVRNRVTAGRPSATPVVREDAPSIARYGLRGLAKTDLPLVADADADAWALFLLNRTRKPTRGLDGATVTARLDATVAAIEAVPLFTGRVHLFQDEWGAPIDQTLRLLGVAWDVDPGRAVAQLVLGTDTALVSTLRRVDADTDAQWTALLGAASGTLGWAVTAGALRTSIAGELSASTGGVDQFTLTWRADL